MFTMLSDMAVVNRRERLRAQKTSEILTAARNRVARGDELTLRAVARDVGLTAPALYRYVASLDDLTDQLGGQLYADLIEVLEAARDTPPADASAPETYQRLTAMAWAFRGWALKHRFEYGLLFANPLHGMERGACTGEGAQRFGATFGALFVQLWHEGGFAAPADEDLDPRIRRLLAQSEKGPVELPLGARYVFVRQWARLYGTVTLEAFGHLSWALSDTQPLFEAMLADNAAELGV